jgi:hypothetical protein
MKMYNIFKQFINNKSGVTSLHNRMKKIQEALGRIESRQIQQYSKNINDAEFRVFSQWGDDGIIQYLINKVPIEKNIFIEFGVENYTESNTRFLVMNNNWSGLIMDGSEENIDFIKNDIEIYFSYNILVMQAFITRENINDLILKNGIEGDIGILSIDIDGNDYWVWDAINCIKPRIVICEYNSMFGKSAKVSIPYRADFSRERSDISITYYGASIAALNEIGKEKGYSLVCSNMAGNNAFFVRNDLMENLTALSCEEAYNQIQVREHKDKKASRNIYDFKDRINEIGDFELYNLENKTIMRIKDIDGICQ